jgi:hypothetical protein
MSNVRTQFSLMNSEIGRLHQFDVKYACAHGDLEEEVYLEIGLGQLVEGMRYAR